MDDSETYCLRAWHNITFWLIFDKIIRSQILPLRASNFHAKEIKKIVILGDGDYLMREVC